MQNIVSESYVNVKIKSIVDQIIILRMDTQTLLNPLKMQVKTQVRLIDLPLIPRYNIFIQNYNHPNLRVNNTSLQKMPISNLHDNAFNILTDWRGKAVFIVCLFLPVLNCLLFLLALYCLFVYCRCLGVHQRNLSAVQDPLKNMVYDHDLCYKLHKDYYAFTIQFKELEGFALNYNRDVRKEMILREERGKANFFIFNGNFWASYNHFGKWKYQHIGLAILSGILAIGVTVVFFIFVLRF